MYGINLDKIVKYKYASFRFFEEREYHVERYCTDDVLLVVYDGVLRFSEDGEAREVRAGEYYIQHKNMHQSAELPSDAPKYLYVHFDAEWCDCDSALARSGKCDIKMLMPLLTEMDRAAHSGATHTEQTLLFYRILLSIGKKRERSELAERLSRYVEDNLERIGSLADLCEELHYSKNYVIRLFRRELGMSPFEYINEVKIRRATYLLETTSRPIDAISKECGYPSYSHFYRLFVEKKGVSPLAWRRRVHTQPTSRV